MSSTTAQQNWIQYRVKRAWESLFGLTGAILLHILALLCVVFYNPFTKTPTGEEIQVVVVDPEADQELTQIEEILEPDPLQDMELDWENFDAEIPPMEIQTTEISTATDEPFMMENIESPILLKGVFATDDASLAGARARGGGSSFGFGDFVKGDLVGTMYDLKRDPSRRGREVHFEAELRKLVEARFSKDSLRNYFRIPKQLFLSHLFIPYIQADKGPEAFGVEKLMEPRQWIIHYTGQMQTFLAGRYRFAGEFDDILLVFVNGELVLEAGWGEPITEWKPTDHVGQHPTFTTHPLVYGDWFYLSSLKPARIDIVIGENPGGWMGGLLLVQQENYPYTHAANGRPILPVFAVQPLTDAETATLHSLPEFAVAEKIPIMGPHQQLAHRAPAATETPDITITIH